MAVAHTNLKEIDMKKRLSAGEHSFLKLLILYAAPYRQFKKRAFEVGDDADGVSYLSRLEALEKKGHVKMHDGTVYISE